MGDLIRRQVAIDAFIRKMRPHNNGDGTMTICVMTEGLVKETLNDLPTIQPDTRLEKIADLVEGSIDHFDLEDAMDLLYQIKEVLNG